MTHQPLFELDERIERQISSDRSLAQLRFRKLQNKAKLIHIPMLCDYSSGFRGRLDARNFAPSYAR